MHKHGLSIIIPCYNEEHDIVQCIDAIPSMKWNTEIIVVDDGSQDNTVQLVRQKHPNVKTISYPKNRGKGYACREGFKVATYDNVLILDADMACPPQEIPHFVKPLFEQNVDFVNGTRLVYPMESGAMKLLHIPGNKLFALIVSILIKQRLTDSLAGFKAFNLTKLPIRVLKEDSWPDFELLIQAKKHNLRIVEVPIHYKARKNGVSKMKTWSHGYDMLRKLLRSIP